MLKIVIIDDEKNVRIVIKKLLSLINIDHTIVGEAASVNNAKKISKHNNLRLLEKPCRFRGFVKSI